jgi:hypothetical protein
MYIAIDDIAITHLVFDEEFTNAIERKQVAQQDVERVKVHLLFIPTFFQSITFDRPCSLMCRRQSRKSLQLSFDLKESPKQPKFSLVH